MRRADRHETLDLMPIEEFDVIHRYFSSISYYSDVANVLEVPIGDDAAVLNRQLFSHADLVVCADTLCEGTHFFPSMSPFLLGIKALTVNVSDIASMGATPFAFTLCLTLPSIDHKWLREFSEGLTFAAQKYGVSLIGGDTTRGPLAISIQILGQSQHGALRRSNAQVGDLIAVTGSLGDAAAGFRIAQACELSGSILEGNAYLLDRFQRPTARLGFAAFDGCHACIDISDGFLQDLEHICRASNLKAHIDPDLLPLSSELRAFSREQKQNPLHYGLIGGEDYELCFTFSPNAQPSLELQAAELGIALSVVGTLTDLNASEPDTFIALKGWTPESIQELKGKGFQHFAH